MKNSHKKKLRDLRRKARGGGQHPSVFRLFYRYHHFDPDDYHSFELDWAEKLAGYWNAIGGAPPAWYRRMKNRIRRAKHKAALIKAIQNDDWEDFSLIHYRRNIRWEWF